MKFLITILLLSNLTAKGQIDSICKHDVTVTTLAYCPDANCNVTKCFRCGKVIDGKSYLLITDDTAQTIRHKKTGEYVLCITHKVQYTMDKKQALVFEPDELKAILKRYKNLKR